MGDGDLLKRELLLLHAFVQKEEGRFQVITKGFWYHLVDRFIGSLINMREMVYDLQCPLNLLGTYGEREVQERGCLEVVQELLRSVLHRSQLRDDLLDLRLDADVEQILRSLCLWCLRRYP